MKNALSAGRDFRTRPAKHLAVRRVGGVLYAADTLKSVLHEFNETGALIWEMLSRGRARADIAARLVSDYDVAPDAAARDTEEFIAELESRGILETIRKT